MVKLSYTSAAARREGDLLILTSEGIGEPGFEGAITNPMKQTQKYKYVFGSGSMLPGYYANAVSRLNKKNNIEIYKFKQMTESS